MPRRRARRFPSRPGGPEADVSPTGPRRLRHSPRPRLSPPSSTAPRVPRPRDGPPAALGTRGRCADVADRATFPASGAARSLRVGATCTHLSRRGQRQGAESGGCRHAAGRAGGGRGAAAVGGASVSPQRCPCHCAKEISASEKR